MAKETKVILYRDENEKFKTELKDSVSEGWKVKKVNIAGAGSHMNRTFMYFALLKRKIKDNSDETIFNSKPTSKRRFKLIGRHLEENDFTNTLPLGIILNHDWGHYYKREDINTPSRWELVSQILRFPKVWEEI